jgi:hypothetical protein
MTHTKTLPQIERQLSRVCVSNRILLDRIEKPEAVAKGAD